MVGIDNDEIVYVPFSRAIKDNRAIDRNLLDILHNISI
jgi:6-phosphofructokinase 1